MNLSSSTRKFGARKFNGKYFSRLKIQNRNYWDKKFSDKNDSVKEYLVKKILGMKIYSQENGHAELVRLGLVTELCNQTPICANQRHLRLSYVDFKQSS